MIYRKINILILLLLFVKYVHAQDVNIIDYYASNNQIVGVPVIDSKNIFRFYPDVAFQNAIRTIRVNYFITNDVFESYLIKQKDGRYWECPLRPFKLGESIQRVEVVIECDKSGLDDILHLHHINTQNDDFNNYLLLRRGDDRALLAKSLLQTEEEKLRHLRTITAVLPNLVQEFKSKIGTVNEIKKIVDTAGKTINKNSDAISHLKEIINQLLTYDQSFFNKPRKYLTDSGFIIMDTSKIKSSFTLENYHAIKPKDGANNFSLALIDALKLDTLDKTIYKSIIIKGSRSAILESTLMKIDSLLDAQNQTLKNLNDSLLSSKITKIADEIDNLIRSANLNYTQSLSELSQSSSTGASSNLQGQVGQLYNSYVENRNSSLLDIRYKNDAHTLIEFTYRNDKKSLQYLQATDPLERLSIFRARLVPFAVYSEKNDRTIKWRRSRVIYEIALNFGYAVIKDDNFKPVLFDVNRLGIGIGIAADTFGDKPSFLSVALSYDINTYSTISIGSNIVDKPLFYMGIGINARAFKDVVNESGKLFSGSSK